MNEFDLIKQYFAPLSSDAGALALQDDAAILNIPQGYEFVITKDAIVSGTHFIGDEPADLIARKLLRVNLSDLAAMGAIPKYYFLALILPKNTESAWIEKFAQGLAEDQKQYNICLMGGDTTAGNSALAMSLTAIGIVEHGKSLKRSGAKIGDDIYVSGSIGDAYLGLQVAKSAAVIPTQVGISCQVPGDDKNYLLSRYRLPIPRIELGRELVGIANSCMDISDGLIQDLGHICKSSRVGAELHAEQIPLSEAVRNINNLPHPNPLPVGEGSYGKAVTGEGIFIEKLIAGGDDYELLFTAPPEQSAYLQKLSARLDLPITRIGTITTGDKVAIFDKNNREIILNKQGYQHF